MLLGKANEKSVAVFNLFIGAMQVIVPFYLIMTSDQSNWVLFNYAAIFLFGFTYLYVGVTLLVGYNGDGLGWYSLWVAILALVYAVVSFVQFNDILNMLTWLMWALLWYLFFLSMALNKPIDQYVGRVAFVQSWVTLTIPALLTLMGAMASPAIVNGMIILSIISILYFIISAISMRFTFMSTANEK